MKKHLIIFINVVFMMSGAVLFMLGIIAASETLFGSKINEMILENYTLYGKKDILESIFIISCNIYYHIYAAKN